MLIPFLGQDFFPTVDSGQFKLHLRAPTGTRIEETARLCDLVEQSIRQQIPPAEVSSIIDNIGIPYSGINLSYSNSAPIGPADADILVSLSTEHSPTEKYVHDLRLNLAQQFPGVTFAFLPADIVSQILNFGLPAPIDIQVAGNDLEGDRRYANAVYRKSAELRARQICAFNSPLTSPNCTSTWTGRKRTRSDSRNTTLRKICSYHSVGVFRPLQHSFSIPRTG